MRKELGEKEDCENSTDIKKIVGFGHSFIGLSQEADNEKFVDYLDTNILNF